MAQARTKTLAKCEICGAPGVIGLRKLGLFSAFTVCSDACAERWLIDVGHVSPKSTSLDDRCVECRRPALYRITTPHLEDDRSTCSVSCATICSWCRARSEKPLVIINLSALLYYCSETCRDAYEVAHARA